MMMERAGATDHDHAKGAGPSPASPSSRGPAAAREECTGTHTDSPTQDARRLHWLAMYRILEPLRMVASTCSCRPVVYEFGNRGGAFLIRRTDHRSGRRVVHETVSQPRQHAEHDWQALLHGRAL